MKPKQSLILVTVILFLNITGHGWTEDRKTISWITQEEAALPTMKPNETSMDNQSKSKKQTFPINQQSVAGPIIKIEKPDQDQF